MEAEFFMFMGYISVASLIIFIFLLIPIWYIGRNNAKKRNKETLIEAFLSNLDNEVKDYTSNGYIVR